MESMESMDLPTDFRPTSPDHIAGILRALRVWRVLRATADAFVSLETSTEISPSEDTPRTRTPPGGSEAFEKRTDCVAPWVKQLARSVSDVPLTLPLPLPWSVGLPPLLSNENNGGILDFAAIAARQLAEMPSELEMPCLG